MTLDEARDHIGAHVIYSSHPGEADEGVIARVDGSYVFVCYGSYGPQATYPEHLVLMRGHSVAEHIRLNMEEAGFPVHVRDDG